MVVKYGFEPNYIVVLPEVLPLVLPVVLPLVLPELRRLRIEPDLLR